MEPLFLVGLGVLIGWGSAAVTRMLEALAFFMLYAEPGDSISLHGAWCRTHLDAEDECTCTPTILTIGAEA